MQFALLREFARVFKQMNFTFTYKKSRDLVQLLTRCTIEIRTESGMKVAIDFGKKSALHHWPRRLRFGQFCRCVSDVYPPRIRFVSATYPKMAEMHPTLTRNVASYNQNSYQPKADPSPNLPRNLNSTQFLLISKYF